MDYDKIGRFIASKRLEKGLTQNELGEKLFVTGKAVSKWERGLSIPDISLLENLAIELDTDIYQLLQIKKKDNIDIDKILEEEKEKINKVNRKKMIVVISLLIVIILVILFKLISFGYKVEHIEYEDRYIDLGRPKFSFNYKNNNDSFSYKSFRSKSVLKSEMKNFVSTLEHITCNDTTYYYNKVSDITIINYKVEGHTLYNTLVYDTKKGNYCEIIKLDEDIKKVGGESKIYTVYSLDEKDNEYSVNFHVYFDKGIRNADLIIYKKDKEHYINYEYSRGTFLIEGDKLIYYREFKEEYNGAVIPNKTEFIMKNDKLIVDSEYLRVVLK